MDMMSILDAALALAAFLGHFSLAVWLFNRLHAIPWPVRLIKVLDKLIGEPIGFKMPFIIFAPCLAHSVALRYRNGTQAQDRIGERPRVLRRYHKAGV